MSPWGQDYWILWVISGLGSVAGSWGTRWRYGRDVLPRVVRWEFKIGVVLLIVGVAWYLAGWRFTGSHEWPEA